MCDEDYLSFYRDLENDCLSDNDKHFCPKCGWIWLAHNDDGSCVED